MNLPRSIRPAAMVAINHPSINQRRQMYDQALTLHAPYEPGEEGEGHQLGLTHGAGAPGSILDFGRVSASVPFLAGLTKAPSISTLISSSEVSPDRPRLMRIMSPR